MYACIYAKCENVVRTIAVRSTHVWALISIGEWKRLRNVVSPLLFPLQEIHALQHNHPQLINQNGHQHCPAATFNCKETSDIVGVFVVALADIYAIARILLTTKSLLQAVSSES